MNEVRKYLEKGNVDFASGFALLKKYCTNEGIISLVEKRRNLQYLIFELKKLAKRPHLKPNRVFVDLDLPVMEGSSLAKPQGADEGPDNGDQGNEPQGADEGPDNGDQDNEPQGADEGPDNGDQGNEPQGADEGPDNGDQDNEPQGADEGDNIIDWHKLEHYQNTKYEDMPNDICRKIYKDNLDLYKQLQHSHQQMKLANSDEGRASFRQEIIDLDAAITNNWRLIDEEISSLSDKDEKPNTTDVKESTLRSRITRALNKETLSNEELIQLKDNYAIALQKELKFSEETLAKLKELGLIDG